MYIPFLIPNNFHLGSKSIVFSSVRILSNFGIWSWKKLVKSCHCTKVLSWKIDSDSTRLLLLLFCCHYSDTIWICPLQVILCQKHSFVYQLTQNMTTDCSLNYQFSTRKLQVQYILCTTNCLCLDIKNNLMYCQKHSFMHQLTQNMTTDCLFDYQFSKRKHQV